MGLSSGLGQAITISSIHSLDLACFHCPIFFSQTNFHLLQCNLIRKMSCLSLGFYFLIFSIHSLDLIVNKLSFLTNLSTCLMICLSFGLHCLIFSILLNIFHPLQPYLSTWKCHLSLGLFFLIFSILLLKLIIANRL